MVKQKYDNFLYSFGKQIDNYLQFETDKNFDYYLFKYSKILYLHLHDLINSNNFVGNMVTIQISLNSFLDRK